VLWKKFLSVRGLPQGNLVMVQVEMMKTACRMAVVVVMAVAVKKDKMLNNMKCCRVMSSDVG
jgi:hypothetical protein